MIDIVEVGEDFIVLDFEERRYGIGFDKSGAEVRTIMRINRLERSDDPPKGTPLSDDLLRRLEGRE